MSSQINELDISPSKTFSELWKIQKSELHSYVFWRILTGVEIDVSKIRIEVALEEELKTKIS